MFVTTPHAMKLGAAAALALLLAGCPGNSAGSVATGGDLPALAVQTDRLPDTPAGEALDWALGRLNQAVGAGELDAVRNAFDPQVLEEISAAAIAAELESFSSARPWELVGFLEPPTPDRLIALLRNQEGYSQARVVVAPSGRLASLQFWEVESTRQTVANTDNTQALEAQGGQ